MKHSFVSISILSFDRRDDVGNCIESLYRCTDSRLTPFEVVVVDQNSNSETKAYLSSLNYPNMRLFFLDQNLGCARGRSFALARLSNKADFVFQADNDLVFTERWLEKLLSCLEADARLGAVQACCQSPDGALLLNGGIIERYDLAGEADTLGYIAYFRDREGIRRPDSLGEGLVLCDYLSGGATLFRRDALSEVSYDENFINGYEDYDLSIQLRRAGWLLAADPGVNLVHNHRSFKSSSFREHEARYVKAREDNSTLFASLLYFVRKYGLNPVRSDGFDSLITDESGRPFAEYSNTELKSYFDARI